jgi:hypothetical protein
VPEQVQRDIHFYAADIGIDNRGRLLPFDCVPPLEYIDAMPLAGSDRRLRLPDDKVAYCWVDRVSRTSLCPRCGGCVAASSGQTGAPPNPISFPSGS